MSISLFPEIVPGRYEVLNRQLRLNGIGHPPAFFWVVRGVAGMYLIETSEDEGFWVREDELEKALANRWIRCAD
jgi:hypothetical protein